MRGLMILVLFIAGCTTTYTTTNNVTVTNSRNAGVDIIVRNPNNPYYDGRRSY